MRPVHVDIGELDRRVSGFLQLPDGAQALYVLGHGAGAGMRHPFMESVASGLYERGIGTLRYQFPYIEDERRSPDSPRVLEATARAAILGVRDLAPQVQVFAGGKSMGGRITSQVAANLDESALSGVIFLGFPLHAPNRPAAKRGEHLQHVSQPMLFLQGTRDDLADLSLLTPIVEKLGHRATLHVIDGANHSFKVLKRSGRTDADVMVELLDTTAGWMEKLCATTAT